MDTHSIILMAGFFGLILSLFIFSLFQGRAQRTLKALVFEDLYNLREQLKKDQEDYKEKLFDVVLKNQHRISDSLRDFSQQTAEGNQKNLVHLQTSLQQHFNQISGAVENKLMQGFEKTNQTFTNIIQRLAIIDDAQKKITDLSKNVVSLQEILSDKKSRGAFGEVQLNTLIHNSLPSNSYSLQHTLSNNFRVDCLLLLPPPTGKIAIDAKFPLENYKKSMDHENPESIRIAAKQQFKVDIRKHIQDISQKYIIAGETGDGALMFIPAEAIFAEIHSHHPDLVEFAWQSRVWMASPSTMMAILTTACAVLKDSATRAQVNVIQDHLRLLAQDFLRFEKRMDNLSKHLQQANLDAEQVHTSAMKISKRFHLIEKVELTAIEEEDAAVLVPEIPTTS
jgi:DNA recombination protein RmuC